MDCLSYMITTMYIVFDKMDFIISLTHTLNDGSLLLWPFNQMVTNVA